MHTYITYIHAYIKTRTHVQYIIEEHAHGPSKHVPMNVYLCVYTSMYMYLRVCQYVYAHRHMSLRIFVHVMGAFMLVCVCV